MTMRRSLLFILLMVATAGLVGCGGSQKSVTPTPENPYSSLAVGTDATLEIMTWNIENFAKAGNTTVEHVGEIVAGLDADVVALQEIVASSSFDRLAANLEGWDGYRAGDSSGGQNLAYLYRTDGPLEVTGIYEILGSESRAFPRRPLVLEGTLDGAGYVVINNHLKCCGDGDIEPQDDWDEETRRQEACQLLHQYVADNYQGKRVIIVGDWNDELSDPAPDNVFQVFLDDPDSWRFVDLGIALNPDVLWSYPGWPSHLDHILINGDTFGDYDAPEAAVQVVPVQNVFEGGFSAYDSQVSDHLPVVVRLVPEVN